MRTDTNKDKRSRYLYLGGIWTSKDRLTDYNSKYATIVFRPGYNELRMTQGCFIGRDRNARR